MTAKEYLSQYINAQEELETLTEEVMRLRSLATKVTVAFESDGSTQASRSSTSKIEACVDRIMETEEKIQIRAGELAEIRNQVYQTIMMVDDSKLRTLLLMRYIGGKSFETIACGMHFTYNHLLKNLHPQALAEVDKILKLSM